MRAEQPTSILVHNRTDRAIDLMSNGTYESSSLIYTSKVLRDRHFIKSERRAFETSNRGRGALSRFPQNIGRLLVSEYCPKNGTVYDPFAGHNSRMQLVFESGCNYIGVDISREFMHHNREVRQLLVSRARSMLIDRYVPSIVLLEISSDKVDLPTESADFTITSPPYWDIEYYGDEPEQLGNAKTYSAFLSLLSRHVEENFRILKRNTFCIWCVNDFRKSGYYLAYHADLAKLFVSVGFKIFDIYIFDLGMPVGAAHVQTMIARMAFPKRHEYCLVFTKE